MNLIKYKDFFGKFYNPSNAIMCVAGNIELQEVKDLCEKYFASIPSALIPDRNLPKEGKQKEAEPKKL